MTGEARTVKEGALWAVGMVVGLLAVSLVLRALGVPASLKLAPEDVVEGTK